MHLPSPASTKVFDLKIVKRLGLGLGLGTGNRKSRNENRNSPSADSKMPGATHPPTPNF